MPEDKAWERWNTHFSTCVEQEVMGVTLRLAQDPSSEHLGTTVWDASIVMAKYFERNMRKGEFSRSKLSGKTAIELGAGMGLGGLALALLGVDVMLTDVKEVLPLLRRNYEQNLSPAAIRASGAEGRHVGRIQVAELDWADPRHLAALAPPYDLVLAADCIYHETLLRDLYRVMLSLTSERSTVLIANERRSESVQSAFLELFGASFTMKKVPAAKQDPDYQHPAIELWLLKRKKGASLANLLQLEAKEAGDLVAAMEALTMLAGGQAADAPGSAEASGSSQAAADEEGGGTAAAGGAPPPPPEAAAAAAAAAAGQGQAAACAILSAAEVIEAAAGSGPSGTAALSSSSSSSSRVPVGDGLGGAAACPGTPAAGVSGRDGDVEMMDASPASASDTVASSRHAPSAQQQQQQQQPPLGSSKPGGSACHQGDQGLIIQVTGGVASCTDGPDTSQLSWATRRQGSMAARLLADVQVPK